MKITAITAALAFITILSSTAAGKDVPVGKGAAIHTIVATQPAAVEIVKPYDRAIKIKKLGRNDTAYWKPSHGSYMVAGEHAYLWCAIYEPNRDKAKYHWIAINTEALNKIMKLRSEFDGGVAFYLVTSDGKQTHLTAYPYSALDAITRGDKVVKVKE